MKYNNLEHFYIWKTLSKQKDKQTQNETYHYRKKNMILGVLKKLCMSSLEKVFLCNFYLYHAMVQKLKPKQTGWPNWNYYLSTSYTLMVII